MRAAREEFMQFLSKEDGATAVEYALIAGIICLAIVGGLARMLLPALARAKAKSNRVKCVNNLGSVFTHGNGAG